MNKRQNKERKFWDKFAIYYDTFIDKVLKKNINPFLKT